MIREIVTIDEEKCDGCGLCVPACAEGAIKIIDGKAKLLAENLCDGLGACLGHCPQDAIHVEKREADDFDEEIVEEHLKKNAPEKLTEFHAQNQQPSHGGGCPSAQVSDFAKPANPISGGCPGSRMQTIEPKASSASDESGQRPTELRQWPVQLHLVPPTAPFLQGADVLFAADCAPFAYAEFHRDILKDKALLIACPKLDDTSSYVDKITAMITESHIKSLTICHMEVPCCGGLMMMARQAVANSGKEIPIASICVGVRGDLIER
jgi:NAD-dependent dihydropyrimidine dehydrogenase PreA subunit